MSPIKLTRLFYLAIPLLTSLSCAQKLLPDNLPACSKQCTVLQQGETGCLPSGGAPQSSQGTYQSCFCQSALLTQLYAGTAVQLCSSCNTNDMNTIQNWYKNFCGKGGEALSGGDQNGGQATTTTQNAATKSTNTAAAANNKSKTSNTQPKKKEEGSWISNHWKWIVMILIVFLGLTALAVGGVILHRRYHRRRRSNWTAAPGSQPNINEWGPGQSVHDLGWAASRQEKGRAAAREEKGKARGVQEPGRARTNGGGGRGGGEKKGHRFSGRFF